MNLVIDKMAQFEHINKADSNLIIKELTGTSIKKTHLAMNRKTSSFKFVLYFLLGGTIENRCFKLDSKFFRCPAE